MDVSKLTEKKARLRKTYDRLKKASQEAESAMQSWHDTQKDQYESEADMVKQQIDQLEALIEEVALYQKLDSVDEVIPGAVVLLGLNNAPAREFLMVEQQGGTTVDGVQTLGTQSPVGQAILGLKANASTIIHLDGKKIVAQIISVKTLSDLK